MRGRGALPLRPRLADPENPSPRPYPARGEKRKPYCPSARSTDRPACFGRALGRVHRVAQVSAGAVDALAGALRRAPAARTRRRPSVAPRAGAKVRRSVSFETPVVDRVSRNAGSAARLPNRPAAGTLNPQRGAEEGVVEQATIAKVTRRIVPFLNAVLFRGLSRPGERRLRRPRDEQGSRPSAVAYGFGAGIFFFSYFVFEVPSNLSLERFGARKWIARIMLSWDLSGAMAFIPIARRARRRAFYSRPRAARRRRGGLLPRHHFLSDTVVPRRLPRAHRRLLHGGDPALLGDRPAVSGGSSTCTAASGPPGWQWLFILEAVPAIILASSSSSISPTAPPGPPGWHPGERDWLRRPGWTRSS